jgi:hypothetical protein
LLSEGKSPKISKGEKEMKKMFVLVLTVGMILTCAGCMANPSHEHEALSQWDRDYKEHWHPCACGEKMDISDHTLEDDACTVCGSIVRVKSDRIDVDNYNEHGQRIRESVYSSDENHKLWSDVTIEHEYDDLGNLLTVMFIDKGEPYRKTEYIVNSCGENRISSMTEYHEEGLHIYEYDEYGYVICEQLYDLKDNLTEYTYYAYEVGENEIPYRALTTTVYYEDNHKPVTARKVVKASDEHGMDLWEKVYEGDMLREERHYLFISNTEDGFGGTGTVSKEIYYEKDGSYTVTDYNVTMDGNGVICSRPMVYVYDKNGELIESRDALDLS